MQFTTAAFALLAAVSIVEGHAIKTFFTGKRDLDFQVRDIPIGQTLENCMEEAKEKLEVYSKTGEEGTYYLSPADGSFPDSCKLAGESYIQHADSVSGVLTEDGESFTLKPIAADAAFFKSAAAGKTKD